MTLREKIENHIGILFFGTILTGFISGVAVYEKIISVFSYKVVAQSFIDQAQAENQKLKEENQKLKDALIDARIELSQHGHISKSEIKNPVDVERHWDILQRSF